MRRRAAEKREVLPEPLYGRVDLAKFINRVMVDGKKSVAERNVYGALEIIKDKTRQDPLDIFDEARRNVMPAVEVRSRRVGGATYQVPTEVRGDRKHALADKWLVEFARKRSERTIKERLAAELMAAASNSGAAVKKKEDTHKMAEANKAFSHFARF